MKNEINYIRGFSFSINIANFEAFLLRIKLTKNLFFQKSGLMIMVHANIFFWTDTTYIVYVHTLHFACNCYLLAITCSKYFLQRRQELMTLYAVCHSSIYIPKVNSFWDLSQNMSSSGFTPKNRPLIGKPDMSANHLNSCPESDLRKNWL